MYLLLGHAGDPCCVAVRAELEARGHAARTVVEPLAGRTRFAWRLDDRGSSGWLAPDGGPTLDRGAIAGVLVRSEAWIDPAGWSADDLQYARAEAQAALLAWLWSLDCPVVNRYPADLWYRPQTPLPYWQPRLRRCGLPTPEVLATNDPDEARAFAGGGALVYAPMLGEGGYLVADDADWAGLAEMQRRTPVYLTRPHGAVQRACVVGPRVTWDGPPPAGADALEAGLLRLADATGLDFLEAALAPVDGRPAVVALATRPGFWGFDDAARGAIAGGLADLLTGATAPRTAVEGPPARRHA